MSREQDPHWQRETEKYEKPIASREFIISLLEQRGEPLTYAHLVKALNLESEDDLEALRRRLKAMVRDGQLIKNRTEGYAPLSKMDLIKGRIIGHPDGFGFLVPDEGGDDLFMSAKEMRAVMHGDRVVARVAGLDRRRNRKEGAIVDVLERAHPEVIGRFMQDAGVAFVVPDNKRITQDIVVPPQDTLDARNGQIVVVAIQEPPTRYRQAIGKVIEVVGDHMAPGMEIDIAIRDHNLPQAWNEAIQEEITHLDPQQIPQDAIQGREDLRKLPLVTIDGEDARDFDDAVFCEPKGKGWRLLVAIADVSHYVKPGTALDTEARERGNSVYFPERVIPMLPEILSNGLCSLNPKVDRLCMVCEMVIGANGTVKDYRFFEGVMRSQARLTYNQVAAMLVERNMETIRQYEAVLPHLENLYACYHALAGIRTKRGAIDFDTTETKIVFGLDRKIERIVPLVRNDAHKLIEECMIAANVAAADFLLKKEVPAVYRIHEGPSHEKLTDLRAFLAELGLSLPGGDKPEAKHYAKLLDSVRERPDRHLIQTVMLRSLSQAVYHPDNVGHFGLAFDHYTHFTSPIRRYPDLLVHRAIRHLVRGKKVSAFRYSHGDMQSFGEHCSMTERRADEATRDAVDWLKCEYMMDKVGEVFPGIITSVTGFGLFVELNDIFVEGLVHVTALDSDYYHFDPVKHHLLGERSGRSYRLADPVTVQVARVDLEDRKIDFLMAEDATQSAEGGQAKKQAGSKRDKGRHRKRGKGKAGSGSERSDAQAVNKKAGQAAGKTTAKKTSKKTAGNSTKKAGGKAVGSVKKKSKKARSRRRKSGAKAAP